MINCETCRMFMLAWLLGELEEEDAVEFDAHIAQCEGCADALAEKDISDCELAASLLTRVRFAPDHVKASIFAVPPAPEATPAGSRIAFQDERSNSNRSDAKSESHRWRSRSWVRWAVAATVVLALAGWQTVENIKVENIRLENIEIEKGIAKLQRQVRDLEWRITSLDKEGWEQPAVAETTSAITPKQPDRAGAVQTSSEVRIPHDK